MEVGEEQQIITEVAVFALDRLFHLQEQIGCSPGGRGVWADRGTGIDVCLIRDGRPDARTALHEHFMAVSDKVMYSRRGYRHPELVVLDLGRNGDSHDTPG